MVQEVKGVGEAMRKAALGVPSRQIPITPEMMQHAQTRQCECGCKYFVSAVSVFTISAIVSPIGQELTGTQPVLLCAECMKPLA